MLVERNSQRKTSTSSEVTNELSDKPNTCIEVKHDLESNWTLWFFQNDWNRSWEENQAQVATFNTVEDFWALYDHIERAAKLPNHCDYSLFKQGIAPAWEDARNCDGGRWMMQLERAHKHDTDRFWMEILMMLIGEAFGTENEYICGCVVSVRPRSDRIAVWVSCNPTKATDSVMKIGQMIKDRLKLGPKMLKFETHDACSKKSTSAERASFSI